MTRKPLPAPLDLPLTPFAAVGIAIWAIAAVITAVFGGPQGWTGICIAGAVLGIPGLLAMVVHDRHRARRRALEL
ncbi:MAG: DUF2530 domain-containing protein [Longispora sp.]|nr:DUF2530 domain-containing protein [Longispora sp. (in: high G+C Gram-positive bacteria)]